MLSAALLALTLAAPPPVAVAEELAAKKDAETLFLRFGAVKAEDYPDPEERSRLARALTRGVKASRADPAIAVGLAEKAVLLQRTADSLTLLGEVEVDLKQRAAAAGHFDEALALRADHVPALLGRADLAMKEDDFAVAVEMYERAQKAGAKAAKAPLQKARQGLEARRQAEEVLKRTEQGIESRVKDAERSVARGRLAGLDSPESSHERLADGAHRQRIAHFVFTYSAGKAASAGGVFALENQVEKVLEGSYDLVADKLGYKRTARTPVLLMTTQEYLARHAGTPQVRAAGYWNDKEIVINGGSAVDERFAMVMVHEFTHAVVAEMVGDSRRAPRWLNEGLAEAMRLASMGLEGRIDEPSRQVLAQLKRRGQLPSVAALDRSFLQLSVGAKVAYALSAYAVTLLIDKGGYSKIVSTLQEMKRGDPKAVFERSYMSVAALDRLIAESL